MRGQMFDVGQGNSFVSVLREGVQNGVFQNIVGKMLHFESAAAHVAFGRKAQKRMFVGRVVFFRFPAVVRLVLMRQFISEFLNGNQAVYFWRISFNAAFVNLGAHKNVSFS